MNSLFKDVARSGYILVVPQNIVRGRDLACLVPMRFQLNLFAPCRGGRVTKALAHLGKDMARGGWSQNQRLPSNPMNCATFAVINRGPFGLNSEEHHLFQYGPFGPSLLKNQQVKVLGEGFAAQT